MGQGEQHRTLSVHIYSCLYSILQLPGASLASVEVLLTLSETLWTDRQMANSGDYKATQIRHSTEAWNIHKNKSNDINSVMTLLFSSIDHCLSKLTSLEENYLYSRGKC